MKNTHLIIIFITAIITVLLFSFQQTNVETFETFEAVEDSVTDICITNVSNQDSVKVYLTIQAPNSVVGMFGIVAGDTTGGKSQGFFYAHKDTVYYSNNSNELLGAVISFEGPAMGCSAAIDNGFKQGINVFEFSINTPYESFDISCEDGVNCIMNVSVSDTQNWTTGYSAFQKTFLKTQNRLRIGKNCGIRGVFPYRCTDCVKIGTQPPSDCFKIKTVCNTQRTCQVARTNHNRGSISLQYLGH